MRLYNMAGCQASGSSLKLRAGQYRGHQPYCKVQNYTFNKTTVMDLGGQKCHDMPSMDFTAGQATGISIMDLFQNLFGFLGNKKTETKTEVNDEGKGALEETPVVQTPEEVVEEAPVEEPDYYDYEVKETSVEPNTYTVVSGDYKYNVVKGKYNVTDNTTIMKILRELERQGYLPKEGLSVGDKLTLPDVTIDGKTYSATGNNVEQGEIVPNVKCKTATKHDAASTSYGLFDNISGTQISEHSNRTDAENAKRAAEQKAKLDGKVQKDNSMVQDAETSSA